MTLDATITLALSAVLANTWAVELPKSPTWPAVVFETESEEEGIWTLGAARYQHVVTVHFMTQSRTDFAIYLNQIRAAMEALEGFVVEQESGDVDYEDLPGVYGKFIEFRIRTTC